MQPLMSVPPSLPMRVAHLESDVHLVWEHLREHAEAHAVVGTKLDDLSGDVRSLAHEVRAEVAPRLDKIENRLDGIDGRLDGIEAAQRHTQRGVDALLAHFQIAVPDVS